MKLLSRFEEAQGRPTQRACARDSLRVGKFLNLFLLLSVLTFLVALAPAALAQDARSVIEGLGNVPHYVPPSREGELPAIEVPSARTTVPPGADELVFTVTQINVTGATALSNSRLSEMTREFVGREVSLSELYGLASQIQTAYRTRGYLLSRALVPAQRIEGGVFRIEVIEGFIEDVFVVGDIGPAKWQVQRYVDRLLRLTPVRTQDIERYLLLANDLPGIQAVAVIRPGTSGPGAAQLVVEVTRDPFDGYISVNNRGSQYAGPWSGAISLGANGFAPYGDRMELIYYRALDTRESVWDSGTEIVSEIPMEQWYGQLVYEGHILDEGLRLLLSATQTLSHPGYTLAVLDMKTRTDRYEADLSFPFVRTRSRSLYGYINFSHAMVRSSVAGASIGRDRLSVTELGLELETQDVVTPWLANFDFIGTSDTYANISISQGLPFFGASSDEQSLRSRLDGTSRFTSVQGRIERSQNMFNQFQLYLAAKAQYSFDTLLSSSEFRVGGDEFGRGYDPSELAGEHGYGLTAEFRYQDRPDWFGLQSYETYAFIDYGSVFNEDTKGFQAHQDLASTGIGARAAVGEDAYFDLELARTLTKPLGSRADDNDTWRLLMRATVQF